jgi:hypothetical protein
MIWKGIVTRIRETRNAYRVFVRKSDGKRPRGTPKQRWEDHVKMVLREIWRFELGSSGSG